MKDIFSTAQHDPLSDETAPQRPGRPAVYASAAERQRAYRQRLRERGMRVVSAVVRDVRDTREPLRSDVIDLSEVRQR